MTDFFGLGDSNSDSSDSETEQQPETTDFKRPEKPKDENKSSLPAPEEMLLTKTRSEFFTTSDDALGVNWNNDNLLFSAPRPPSPDPADAWKSWKNDLKPINADVDDEAFFQEGNKASSMRGKTVRPAHVQDMAVGWSRQFSHGEMETSIHKTTIRELPLETTQDERKIKIPKNYSGSSKG